MSAASWLFDRIEPAAGAEADAKAEALKQEFVNKYEKKMRDNKAAVEERAERAQSDVRKETVSNALLRTNIENSSRDVLFAASRSRDREERRNAIENDLQELEKDYLSVKFGRQSLPKPSQRVIDSDRFGSLKGSIEYGVNTIQIEQALSKSIEKVDFSGLCGDFRRLDGKSGVGAVASTTSTSATPAATTVINSAGSSNESSEKATSSTGSTGDSALDSLSAVKKDIDSLINNLREGAGLLPDGSGASVSENEGDEELAEERSANRILMTCKSVSDELGNIMSSLDQRGAAEEAIAKEEEAQDNERQEQGRQIARKENTPSYKLLQDLEKGGRGEFNAQELLGEDAIFHINRERCNFKCFSTKPQKSSANPIFSSTAQSRALLVNYNEELKESESIIKEVHKITNVVRYKQLTSAEGGFRDVFKDNNINNTAIHGKVELIKKVHPFPVPSHPSATPSVQNDMDAAMARLAAAAAPASLMASQMPLENLRTIGKFPVFVGSMEPTTGTISSSVPIVRQVASTNGGEPSVLTINPSGTGVATISSGQDLDLGTMTYKSLSQVSSEIVDRLDSSMNVMQTNLAPEQKPSEAAAPKKEEKSAWKEKEFPTVSRSAYYICYQSEAHTNNPQSEQKSWGPPVLSVPDSVFSNVIIPVVKKKNDDYQDISITSNSGKYRRHPSATIGNSYLTSRLVMQDESYRGPVRGLTHVAEPSSNNNGYSSKDYIHETSTRAESKSVVNIPETPSSNASRSERENYLKKLQALRKSFK